jgi:uncharacterized protein (DUF1697 family)
MVKYVAFLRGINVGGHKIIKMDSLRDMFSALGFSQVKSYIQSGNIIFETAESDGHALERHIEAHLQTTLGYEVTTFIRTLSEMVEIVKYDPFQAERSAEGVKVYVTFLATEPSHERKMALMSLSNDTELFQLKHRELFYLGHPTTKKVLFSNNFIERELGLVATTRNWATVNKIVTMF